MVKTFIRLALVTVLMSSSLPFDAAIAGTPDYEKALIKGLAQMKKKDYEGAVASFTEVLKDNSSVYEAYLNRAEARVEIKDLEGALSDFDQAIKINPNVVESYVKRGDLHTMQGNHQAALDDYTQAARLNPKDIGARFKKASALKQNGEFSKAADDYSGVLKVDPNSIEAREGRAECRKLSSDFSGAIDDYDFLLKKYKQKMFALHYDIGETYLQKGDKALAKDHFTQLIAFYSKTLGKARKGQGMDFIRRGLAYYQLDEPDKALSDIEAGAQLLPGDARARYYLGHAKLGKGDTEGAIKELDEALRINPKLNQALLDRAAANVSKGEFLAARKDLDIALATEKSADGLVSRALARLAVGDVAGGVNDLNDAKKLNPKDVERRQQAVSNTISQQEGKGEKDLALAQTLEQLALFDLAGGSLDSAESLVKKAIVIQEKSLSKQDPKLAYSLIMLGKIHLQENQLLRAEALFRTAMVKLRAHPDSQKYAVFNLEDCARVLIQSSNTEDAGSILADTRMVRATGGLTELAFTGDLLRRAEQSIDAYRQKKKYDRQEDLVRKVAAMRSGDAEVSSGGGGGEEEEAPVPVPETSQTIDKPIRDKWALIVGISNFKDNHINLRYAAKDAKDFADFLVKEKDFAPDHVQLLTDGKATRANILSLLGNKWLPRVAEPDDLVVIYFSGHGSPSSLDVGGVNYLVAHDTDVNDLYSTGIAMQDLARIIKERVHSERIMLLLDACHSGSVSPSSKGLARQGNVNVETIVQGTGQLVLSSSSPEQRSWESKRYEGSVFTRHLMEGLKRNGKYTKLGDAFNYMNDETRREVLRDRGVLQTPVMRSKWEGRDLVIGAPAKAPSRGMGDIELPDHMANPNNVNQDATNKGGKPAKPKGASSKHGR